MSEIENFYYHGKYFNTEQELREAVEDFSLRHTNKEDFDLLFNMLKRDIFLNICMRDIKITNQEISQILEGAFAFILGKLFKMQRDLIREYNERKENENGNKLGSDE